MTPNAIEIEGTLQADGNLVLDQKPAMRPGRVRVALQAINRGDEAGNDIVAVLQGIRTAQQARRHACRSKEEIDAAIDAMRDEDEERMQAIERLHSEGQQGRSGKPA